LAENLQGSQVIAKIFGVTTRRIEQLKSEGIIQGSGRPTKYDLLPTIQAYIKYLSDKAYGREQKETAKELEESRLHAEARFKTAKAERAEMELEELRGTLHSAEDVEAVMTDHILLLRSMILALPGRLAVDVCNAATPAEAADVIKNECYAMLNQLSEYEYNPDEYQRRVRERNGWDARIDDGTSDGDDLDGQ